MNSLLPGAIVSFRECLEALLILALLFEFLEKTGSKHLMRNVIYGFISSVVFSLTIGFILFTIGGQLKKIDVTGNIWESIASLVAVGLVSTFIIWMARHGSKMKKHVENKAAAHLNRLGIFIVSFVLISREGVEIALFFFAGQYSYLSVIIGLVIAILISFAIYFSLLRLNISAIFKITLLYLIIQSGYLLGYGFHEGLSALHSLNYIGPKSILLIKVFDFSHTILNHKEGLIGLPFNVFLGWYSKPEWIQFAAQYIFTFSLLLYWMKKNKTDTQNSHAEY